MPDLPAVSHVRHIPAGIDKGGKQIGPARAVQTEAASEVFRGSLLLLLSARRGSLGPVPGATPLPFERLSSVGKPTLSASEY
jgi:hypothetical protein